MAIILTKKKDSTGIPATANITNSTGGAELAVNTADKRLYTKNGSNVIVELGINPSSLDVGGNASVKGTFKVHDESNLEAVSVNSTLSVTGAQFNSSTFTIRGAISGASTLNVSSDIISQTNVSSKGTLGVGGIATFDSGIVGKSTLDITGNASVLGTFNITGNVSSNGTLTTTGAISDGDGNLRDIPKSQNVSGAYTLQASDVGNQVNINSANVVVTVPGSVFNAGDIVSLISINGCTATIACTGVTAIKAGELASTASFTLAANGVANVLFTHPYTAGLAVLTGNI